MSKLRMSIGLVFVIFAALCLRPVPSLTEANCITVQGLVEQIYEAGTKDIVLQLKDDNRTFYINRGYEKIASADDLLGKNVTIKYPKYWTPLDPKSNTRHISYLECNNKIIYSEIVPQTL